MKTTLRATWILILLLAFTFTAAGAQSPEYRIDVDREFGYGAGADVRGNFAFGLYGDLTTVRSVTYMMDGEPMATLDSAPFRFRFRTGDYPSGWHQITAVVTTTDGREVTTPVVTLHFLSAEAQGQAMTRVFGLVLGLIALLVVGGMGAQFLSMRGGRKPGQPRNYGLLGGAICPKCDRPFPIHIWSVNMMAGRLDRCDNCGKWSVVRRAAPEMLQAAETAEQAAARQEENAPLVEADEQERLRRLLDDSRYTDGK
jgi:hypothetical protein